MSEKTYSRVEAADEMIHSLCEKQPAVLWCVKPDSVTVLGIENKERSEKNKVLAKIKPVKGCEKALFQINNIPIRYIIEVYWSDWNDWNEKKKQWIIFHELLHIHHEIGKSIKHDCEDFKIILDKVGVNWIDSDKLPNLIEDKVEFNLDLRPSLEDQEEENDNIDDEKHSKSRKKAKEEAESTKEEKPEDEEVQHEDADDEEKEDGDVF